MSKPFSLSPEDRNQRIRPATYLHRAAAVHVRRHVTNETLEKSASKLFGDDRVTPFVLRGAVSPATTTGATWAAPIAGQAVDDFVVSIETLSAAAGLIQRGMKLDLTGFAQIKLPRRTRDLSAAGSWVNEGSPIRVRNLSITAGSTIEPRKMGVIVGFTREIAESSNLETVARATISEAAAQVLDATMFDANAGDATRPPGLLNGVAPLTPTAGGGANAFAADVKQLVGALAAAGAGLAPVIVCAAQQAASIKVAAGPQFDVPVLPSAALVAGTVIMVEPSSFVSGFDSVPEFQTSSAGLLHFEDTTPADISAPPSAVAAPVKSMFQTDSFALKTILRAAWGMRAPHVAVVNGVTW